MKNTFNRKSNIKDDNDTEIIENDIISVNRFGNDENGWYSYIEFYIVIFEEGEFRCIDLDSKVKRKLEKMKCFGYGILKIGNCNGLKAIL